MCVANFKNYISKRAKEKPCMLPKSPNHFHHSNLSDRVHVRRRMLACRASAQGEAPWSLKRICRACRRSMPELWEGERAMSTTHARALDAKRFQNKNLAVSPQDVTLLRVLTWCAGFSLGMPGFDLVCRVMICRTKGVPGFDFVCRVAGVPDKWCAGVTGNSIETL